VHLENKEPYKATYLQLLSDLCILPIWMVVIKLPTQEKNASPLVWKVTLYLPKRRKI
jgi:hypothetical protein